MRIRKRFPPPSDPQLTRPVVVQQNIKNESLPSDLPNLSLPQPSDQPMVNGGKSTTWVFFGGNSNQEKQKNKEVEDEDEDEDEKLRREKKESFYDNKKESFLLLPQPSSSSDLDGRLCEGDDHKVVPFTKRSRDSYHHTSNINTMKSKTNKKGPQENGNEEQEQEHYEIITEEGFESNINSDYKVGNVNRKSKRGSVILEGSRCSRVNGRGWRCCQQTLVGYSLCEHHLGKGRLRSMNSVRNSTNKKKKEEKSLPNDHENYGVDEDIEKKSLMVTRRQKSLEW